ncbi:MAG: tail fiber domain-containing protein [Verrucomicrobiae bacterium]|nr:tail fiber domain-containing protein [Verrucomicrobiae bacterium]
MKTNLIASAALALALLSTLHPQLSTCQAQGTAFTYQGRLDSGGTPYTGLAEMQFSLWDAASGGSQLGSTLTVSAVGVTNGLFAVTLDFGNQFSGADRWLEIAVRTNLLSFVTLSPRQRVTSAPYAIRAASAGSVAASGITGTLAPAQLPAAVVTNSASGVNLAGTFSGNGAGLTNLSAWQLGGNAGTSAGTHFMGTTDNQPLEVRVNNRRALRLEPAGSNSVNVIGGYVGNLVSSAVVGGTVGGGGAGNYWGWSYTNRVLGDFGTVGGGANNTASGAYALIGGGLGNAVASVYSTVAGGYSNSIIADATSAGILGGQQNSILNNYAVVGGGYSNTVSGWGAIVGGGRENVATGYLASVLGGWRVRANGEGAFAGGGGFNGGSLAGNLASGPASVVVGGLGNTASGPQSFIGGGWNNTASGTNAAIAGGVGNTVSGSSATVGGGWSNDASGWYSTVGGGYDNTAGGGYATVGGGYFNKASGEYATIPGGRSNTATNYAFAAGNRAKADHTGAFVWADATDADFASSGTNQFLIRASGGVGIGTVAPGALLQVGTASAPAGRSEGMIRLASRSAGGGQFRYWDIGVPEGGANTDGKFYSFVIDDPQLDTQPEVVVRWNTGFVGIGLTNPSTRLHVNGAVTATAFNTTSDRNLKENFQAVDPQHVLAKVLELPVWSWNFIGEGGARHLGPMAQDFHAAFGLGDSDKTIATVDADGVALAAIQGLNRKLEVRSQEAEGRIRKLEEALKRRDAENAALRRELAELRQLLQERLK